MVKFPHIFDFRIALAERLWKKKGDLIPSGVPPEEKSASTAVLNHILDHLLVATIPEYDSGAIYRPDPYAISIGSKDLHRVLKLLDLMTFTNRAHNSVLLINLVSRPQDHLPTKYKHFLIPLIPNLKARFQTYHASHLAVLDLFLRTLVERYLQDLLGSPSRQPDASATRVNCGCGDCAMANQFLRSDAMTEMFRLSQQRRSHIEGQLRTACRGGVTMTTVTTGTRRYALQVTKTRETWEAGQWSARVQKALTFLAAIGTPDELVRIMGVRYPDVQAALAGTKRYEMGTLTLAIPSIRGTPAATNSTTVAAASGSHPGPVVAGVKRKAVDDGDVIDLSSD